MHRERGIFNPAGKVFAVRFFRSMRSCRISTIPPTVNHTAVIAAVTPGTMTDAIRKYVPHHSIGHGGMRFHSATKTNCSKTVLPPLFITQNRTSEPPRQGFRKFFTIFSRSVRQTGENHGGARGVKRNAFEEKSGALSAIRTRDLLLRREPLYPTKL